MRVGNKMIKSREKKFFVTFDDRDQTTLNLFYKEVGKFVKNVFLALVKVTKTPKKV